MKLPFETYNPIWKVKFEEIKASLQTSQYQQLKEGLVKQNWKDGNQYNEGKDSFLKHYEKIAIEWYAQENRTL